MPIDIRWGNEDKTYVYQTYHSKWTWKEHSEIRKKYHEMIRTVSQRVDTLADFTDVSTLPTNLFSNMREVTSDRLENEGYFLIFEAGFFVRSMFQIIVRVVPTVAKNYMLVSSLEEAQKIISSGRADEAL